MVDAAVLGLIVAAPVTQVTSRAAIYEADGETLWMPSPGFTQGSVSVDFNRDERRTLEITLENVDGGLRHPSLFDYDKVIKVWRGVRNPLNGDTWEAPLGTFYIDSIKSQHFPHDVSVTARDGTKRLLGDKFPTSITFSSGRSPESLIKAIAINGGVTKYNLPPTGQLTTREHAFERGTSRWEAVAEIANAYAYDIYFDADGYLVMMAQQDPASSPEVFTFQTGPTGSLSAFERKTTDTRIYNHVVVTGTGVAPNVYAVAENNNPSSPTSVQRIGRRTYEYVSQFISTTAQCQDVANKFLAIHALEDYELSLTSLVLPWLEAGNVVKFLDPDAGEGEPDRFLLTDFRIPLKMGQMDCAAKRVVIR